MSEIKVTVGIPVYNSENHIGKCLDSILNQSMKQENIEMIVVNDGSTDGTETVLKRYKANYSNIKCINQENTGGPGAPRNKIIEEAQGEFIFFVDADDYLGREACERMYNMGKENGTDIILGKFVGVNGRVVAKSMFRTTQPKTTVFESLALEAIGPTKMFRRSFLLERNVRFPVGVCTAEDQPFMVQAYIQAKGISIVADYPCYYIVNHTDKEHASVMPVKPDNYYHTLEQSVKIINRLVRDQEKRERLIAIYLIKELTTGRSIMFAGSRMNIHEKKIWLQELNYFLEKWTNERIIKQLPLNMRIYLSLARNKKLGDLIQFAGRKLSHTV